MLCGEDIVCIAPNPWDEMWRRRHYLMARLARDNRVLWIEPSRFLLFPLLEGVRRPSSKGILSQVRENLFVYKLCNPLPFEESALRRGIGLIQKLNEWCCVVQVKTVMRHLGFANPILWLYYTEVSESLIGQCNEKLAVCDVFDKYSAYSCYDAWGAKRLKKREKQLLRRGDLVFAVSEQLCAYCRQFNENVFLVPNGVDRALYEAIGSLPEDIALIPHPIVGFTGKIAANKIDLEVIRYLVESRPEWSVVLVGPIFPDLQRVIAGWPKYENLHLLGQKELWELPPYLKAFDVCIIPYLCNEERHYCDPLKAYEYLAAGKAIVTTDFSPAPFLSDLMQMASSPEEFVSHIEGCLRENDETLERRRIEVARRNSWDVRVQKMGQIIGSYLAAR